LTDHALELLTAYDWPGNVRELQNVIERAVILSQRGPLRVDLVLRGGPATSRGRRTLHLPNLAETRSGVLSEAEMSRRERDTILGALEWTGWKISGAARMLGVKPTTLASRLKRLGIERPTQDSSLRAPTKVRRTDNASSQRHSPGVVRSCLESSLVHPPV